jgi:hypothetical protein
MTTTRAPLRAARTSGRNARTPATIAADHSGNVIALPGGGTSVRIRQDCAANGLSLAESRREGIRPTLPVIVRNQNTSWGFIRLRFDRGNRRQGEKVPHAMKPTTDEPPRLDYSRAHLEAMPITIDVYSEEATRLFAVSDEHEVFTPVPIPGYADSLALDFCRCLSVTS